MSDVSDGIGRRVRLAAPPSRIVSLVPSLTETLFAIGCGDRVVGVTEFCIAPAAQVAGLPKLRGTKNPDIEAILALEPDLVLAAKEENRQRDVARLEEAGVPVYVTDICSVGDAAHQLAAVAELLAAADAIAPLLAEIDAARAEARERAAGHPPVPALAFIWRDPWMAIGEQNYADDLLRICGMRNLALSIPGRYPRAALPEFMSLCPQVVLLPDEPYRFSAQDQAAFAPFAGAPAVRNRRLLLCDGALLTWYGPRTPEALRHFAALLDE